MRQIKVKWEQNKFEFILTERAESKTTCSKKYKYVIKVFFLLRLVVETIWSYTSLIFFLTHLTY